METDLALALTLADLADEITLSRFRAHDLVVETKPDLTPVSEADHAVERAMRERVASARPEDEVFGEEFGGAASARRRWIVDPIDGTKGYVRGMPVWATLLALQVEGEVTLGVVSAPALERRWWAARGQGAFGRDGAGERPLRVSAVKALEDAQLCWGGFQEWLEVGRLGALLDLGSRCWRTRGYGDFWQYMLVAEGAAEIAVDPTVGEWDIAAPSVIVREAGGTFSGFGAPQKGWTSGLATNGLLHDTARAILEA